MQSPYNNMDKKLTPKQQRFKDEYIVDLNATKAAIRAGYSQKNADKIGSELLGKTRIAEAIQKAMNERSKRTEITADMVLKEFAKIGFSNMKRYARWNKDGINLVDSEDIEDDVAACVQELSQTATDKGLSVKFKLYDKRAALESIGRHLGMFKDKVDHSGNVQINWPLPRTALDEPYEE